MILTGEKFGMLTAIRYSRTGYNWAKYWDFICECGTEKEILVSNVKKGKTKSCGCLAKKTKSRLTHGMRRTPEYGCFTGMKSRCYNPKVKTYPYYGGRGIKICDRWLNSFENFYKDMGDKPEPKVDYSIDRIDNDGDYAPGNCRWITRDLQRHNSRATGKSKYKGVAIHGDKFRATCRRDGKSKIGSFYSEIKAAKAYNKWAIEMYGENATLNLFENEK